MIVEILIAGPYRDYAVDPSGLRAKTLPVGRKVDFPDDYALYLIKGKLAKATEETPQVEAEEVAPPVKTGEESVAAEEPAPAAVKEIDPPAEEPAPAAVKENEPAKKKGSRQ